MDNFAFLVPWMMFVFGLIFLALAWHRVRSALAWSCGFLLAGLAFFVVILPLPVEVMALSADAFFIGAFFCYGQALLEQYDCPRFTTQRVAFTLLAFIGASIAVLGLASLTAELVIVDTSISLLLAFSVAVAARKARRAADRILLFMSGAVVADTIIRLLVFTVFVTGSDALEGFNSSPYSFVMQASVGAMSFCFALSILGALASETLSQYREAAERDPLTGLLNRRGFERAISALSAREQKNGVVISGDIDHFKNINDTYGHAAGDQVLVDLATMLRQRMPGSIAARFGGEEFVIYLPDQTLTGAVGLAQSLRLEFVAREWRSIGIVRQITVSFGIAAVAAEETSIHDTISRADKALYAAKTDGRNRVMLSGGGQPGTETTIIPFSRVSL